MSKDISSEDASQAFFGGGGPHLGWFSKGRLVTANSDSKLVSLVRLEGFARLVRHGGFGGWCVECDI